ncbi:MAG: AraC family transcriptional regulator [[Actinobacillus] rossii]|uniref:Helix-turn-helix domain-containing protein n=1 Tax=[Actinobacillus] rossii TaxID=123820 RepID=A0A380TM57_9PAST|nr:AraC family transcriptional regulator [[Actinobacillus] rossii]MDY3124139.1 AraC family transcriptional regulator [[Actinobacillus] rossii]MDY4506409.1 AraC family transcriptional regulator [[Actinobacillus] rossii]SUT88125.1 helix-turn-helix domain-containing protein [[Actinobacillus] rossii]
MTTLSIKKTLTDFVQNSRNLHRTFFANSSNGMPSLAYQVDFPRLEIVLDGEQIMEWNHNDLYLQQRLQAGDFLFISTNAWNKATYILPTTTLSILFGKQQLGLSLSRWDNSQLVQIEQLNTPRRGARVGAFILQALSELSIHYQEQYQQTAHFLLKGLVSNCLDLLSSHIKTTPKTSDLFEGIRQYIELHFTEDLTRESVAKTFHISPNYLSFLFQQKSRIGLNQYINQLRLEHAKSLLKRYDLNVQEIALAAGFKDSNYFCRVFKKKTDRSPSEYRSQYHSQLLNEN